ncbi:MAG: hypothetical protein JNL08_01560 [Planctomycetes bacterium]|nr:hypothetical protein [Planctomycetota bacterium]
MSHGGQALAIDTTTGTARVLGASNVPFCNAMAVDGTTYYATGIRDGSTRLFTVDPVSATGGLSRSLGNIDVRALADGPNDDELLAVINGPGDADRLMRIRPSTGAVSPVGLFQTGMTGIQAMVRDGSNLLAWDVQLGLVRISMAHGAAVDLFPGVGTSGAHIQFLTFDEQGRLLGGQDQLFEIDRLTGVATLIPGSACLNARGGELRRGTVRSFDQPCGDDAVLTATSTAVPGDPVFYVSTGHAPNAFVVFLLAEQKQQTPVPGTNCKLGINDDDPLFGTVANAAGTVSVGVKLPDVLGFELFAQCLCQQPGSGTPYITNGVHVRATD